MSVRDHKLPLWAGGQRREPETALYCLLGLSGDEPVLRPFSLCPVPLIFLSLPHLPPQGGCQHLILLRPLHIPKSFPTLNCTLIFLTTQWEWWHHGWHDCILSTRTQTQWSYSWGQLNGHNVWAKTQVYRFFNLCFPIPSHYKELEQKEELPWRKALWSLIRVVLAGI